MKTPKKVFHAAAELLLNDCTRTGYHGGCCYAINMVTPATKEGARAYDDSRRFLRTTIGWDQKFNIPRWGYWWPQSKQYLNIRLTALCLAQAMWDSMSKRERIAFINRY